jgi:hypothetical protein
MGEIERAVETRAVARSLPDSGRVGSRYDCPRPSLRAMEDDPESTTTADGALAERLMHERHWVSNQGLHYVVSSVLRMADPDTPRRAEPMWSVHGRLERDDETCPAP